MGILVLLSAAMLFATIKVTEYYGENDVKDRLKRVVRERADMLMRDDIFMSEINNNSNHLRPDTFIDDDVKLIYYNNDGSAIADTFSYTELENVDLTEHDVREVEINGTKNNVYDKKTGRPDEDSLWVRGVISAGAGAFSIINNHPIILILFPIFIALGILGAYLLMSKFLSPVNTINKTASEIKETGDLSKRIELKNNKDEFGEIAEGFNSMLDTLEDNYDAEKHFASNASHELRTPVAVILAECDYATKNAKTMDDMYESIGSIEKQGYRMSHLIETLLIFTRIEQGTEKYPKEMADLSALVTSIVNDYKLINEKNQNFETFITAGISAPVNIDLFTLLISNLLSNAVRYGKDCGIVRIVLNTNHPHNNSVKENIILSVTDNGIGISDTDKPHIFERFYRGDKSRSTKGTGLGLALAKQIVEYHGGSIEVKSKEGLGSTFTVTIPTE